MLALLALAFLPQTAAPELQPGPWRAELASPGGPLAFGLWLDPTAAPLVARVSNGLERLPAASARYEAGLLVLRFDPYDAELRARAADDGKSLSGTWTRRGAGRTASLPFVARAVPEASYDAVVPARATDAGTAGPFQGRWAVRFEHAEDQAVGEFTCGPADDPWISGTFLTTLGDYRYLDGRWDEQGFTLACFDGAHAFLFRARRGTDGALAGDFWSGDRWHEGWSATRDADARLPDAFGLTRAVAGVELGALAYPDLAGELRRLDDPAFAGRARIVQLFGTWCPNCNDEASFLAELDRRYRARGLSILGLAFEVDDDHAYAAERVKSYVRRYGIGFPILIAGTSDKQQASQAFPLVDRVRAFPTTLFLDAEKRVRAVHTGWSGPAAGAEHARLKAEIERLVEELLAESAR